MASQLKHTVAPSGGDYTTLAAAITHLAAAHSDLVSLDVYADIEISGSWSSADTTAIDIDGFTTDAAHYINIYTTGSARHAGIWSTSKYIHAVNAAGYSFYIREPYVRFDGIQFGVTGPDQSHFWFGFVGLDATSSFRLSNCIFKGHGNATYQEKLFNTASGIQPTTYMWNCISYNWGGHSNSYLSHVDAGSTLNIYSSTFIWHADASAGLRKEGGTMVLKNCYSGTLSGVGGGNYFGSPTMTTCAASDATGDTGLDNIEVDTDTFVNVSAGTEDFHLAADGLSPLKDVGTDTSGEGAPLNFTTDIDGNTRSTWDIGADEYAAGGPSPIGPSGAIASAEDVDGAAMMRGTIQSEV